MLFEPSDVGWTVYVVGSIRVQNSDQDSVQWRSVDGVYPTGALSSDRVGGFGSSASDGYR